ncbi:MAG: hypothetical protein HRU18_07400 [Pseudoalteromonas sp.]|uniref:hypothetical protein n=1 Tax=Pseudoalteromonas sp. TaxID=53249 RepID=UPI001D8C8666|nr:hypothetical protein [Pseudoalteromonas sp.]NRA78018.1 hypothetical protein [Pseudoalteromonas sp.]
MKLSTILFITTGLSSLPLYVEGVSVESSPVFVWCIVVAMIAQLSVAIWIMATGDKTKI